MATTSSPILITFNGKIYNISNFIPKHPGGEKVLLNIAGAEVNHVSYFITAATSNNLDKYIFVWPERAFGAKA